MIIASHPCVLQFRAAPAADRKVRITEDCTGCEACLRDVECPAITWDEEAGKASIDPSACNGCGVCLGACPVEAIVVGEGKRA